VADAVAREEAAKKATDPLLRESAAILADAIGLLGKDAGRTIVVFDAAKAPDGLPGRYTHKGLRVWFAREYPDADSLIEELIDEDNAPTSLVVVSSDRRLQAAAGALSGDEAMQAQGEAKQVQAQVMHAAGDLKDKAQQAAAAVVILLMAL
jgi:predicted RNA-binding protein with PIN domain